MSYRTFAYFYIFNEIKNQFGKVIKILPSDNAKEYFSSTLSSFLSLQGILHQSTCPQRKNRHLVETTCNLLFNANACVQQWGDAILIAGFLINRMPFSTLDNKIPISIISPREPLYHVPPCIFGCTCFVHDVFPGLDKFSARAIKCVFLGYSRLQKGYQCYSPEIRRYYMSADVTFFEETPFFSSSQQDINLIQQVLPIPSFSPITFPIFGNSNQEENQSHPPTNSSFELSSTTSSVFLDFRF